MIRRRFSIILLFTFWFSANYAGHRMTCDEYIEHYKDIAIKEMCRSGIPASITLGQGIMESECGNSSLATKANNHFGIKCHTTWEGKRVYKDDDEKDECFRKYPSAEDSYRDHTELLSTARRYSFLFNYKRDDYKKWAKGIKKAGYATNPHYAQELIKVIEGNKLYALDSKCGGGSKFKGKKEIPSEISIPKRPVKTRNGVKYVIVGTGDTFYKIVTEFDMMRWEIYRYNELTEDSILHQGDILYLQPKRWRAEKGNEFHIVKQGETLYDISQLYAMKLKKLYRKNRMEFGTQPRVGQKLWLRCRIPKKEWIKYNDSLKALESPAEIQKQ